VQTVACPGAPHLLIERPVARGDPTGCISTAGRNPTGCLLNQLERKRSSDTGAHHVALLDTEMIKQCHLIPCIRSPRVGCVERPDRLPSIALVHRDQAKRVA